MITRINKIKNLGIFSDFKWDKGTPDFKRYNLVYGWNGCGKTTLSKLFSALESGSLKDYPDLEYDIELSSGDKLLQGQSFNSKIRVFNEDYIRNNVRIFEGSANSIVILGEESQEILNEIRKRELLLYGDSKDPENIGLIEDLRRTEDGKEKAIEKRSGLFTSVARTIGASFGGEAVRNYTKKNSEPDFRELDSKEELVDEEVEKCLSILKQQEAPLISEIEVLTTIFHDEELPTLDSLSELPAKAKELLQTTVESITIEKLRDNPDISNWVEEGLGIHKNHNSQECEFCGQKLPPLKLAELGNYFNEADQKLKQRIESLLELLRELYTTIKSTKAPDTARLYKDLQVEYDTSLLSFETATDGLLKNITKVGEKLQTKKLKTWEPLEMQIDISTEDFSNALTSLNKIISRHNADTVGIEAKRKQAQTSLKNHYLSKIFDDVKALDLEVAERKQRAEILLNGNPDEPEVLGITQIKGLIDADRGKISSEHKGCDQLNEMLKTLLGREEIVFEVQKDENGEVEGYAIKRGEGVADHLSDGEQTAIAFAYFCTHLTDKDFKLTEGMVVLDDPVSSLDSGMLFRISAYIQTKLIKANQLFIFTHNYDFFNQTKQWFKNSPQINNLLEEGQQETGQLLMLQSVLNAEKQCRASALTTLDEMLRDYESEYHYLFKKLYEFDIDNPQEEGLTVRAIYDYPNMGRKLLECFLSFRCPKVGSFFVRMMALKDMNEGITAEDINYVYSFANSHSHLDTKNGLIQFDPTLVISGRDSIKRTLALVELADEKHFKAMKKATKVT